MIITIVLVAAVIGGIWLGRQGNTKNPKVGPNGEDGDCNTSCSDLHNQHNDLCVAQGNLAAAEAHADRMLNAMLNLGGGAIAALAAAIGTAAFIAAITALLGATVAAIVVIAGFIIAGALLIVLLAALAAWITAQAVAGEKRRIKSELSILKSEALDNVHANCTEKEAQDCINSLVPCS